MTDKTPVLLVVDMTNDFIYKEYNKNLALERARHIIPRLRRLQDIFLEHGHPVIYASDRHVEEDYEIKKWGYHSMKGTKGSEIVQGLAKDGLKLLERNWSKEQVKLAAGKNPPLFDVEKGTYSSFVDNGGKMTALPSLLEALGIMPGSEIYIAGLHAACGVKHTAADAWFRGLEPVIVSDCVDSFDNPDGRLGMNKEEALRYEEYWYDGKVMTSEEISRSIEGIRLGH